MSLDVPYERLGLNSKIEYIPLKLAIEDVENVTTTKNDIANKTNNSNFVKQTPNSSPESFYDNGSGGDIQYNNMLHFITICMLTVFCVIVLLYAVYYFIILRDRHNNALNPQLLFV
ncbi:ac78 [Malacosoma neustria nucleopolyhedrovirus]|uniref:ac78 n=1 Tax=Malacosoma neustria nuclear polyhedrosis virus TaxID=38012 RepID=UPI000E358DC3|nr:ac78 [Malacosoma neustria nucleopolyhedrovirus]AUF81588.1 ac78 [Malacosoma neustria nucleopolyhedrovirus]